MERRNRIEKWKNDEIIRKEVAVTDINFYILDKYKKPFIRVPFQFDKILKKDVFSKKFEYLEPVNL